jgi:hypothetical protein
MRNLIWTQEVRRVLYKSLVDKFGPIGDWELEQAPFSAGSLRAKEFDNFLDSFATVVGAKSGLAVLNQICWALHKGDVPRGQVKICYENTEAARWAGFI